MSLLRTIGIGRLTADPEVKQVKINDEEVTVAEFTVAVDADFGGRDAPTDFVKVVAWRRLAETASNHLGKGRQIFFEGRPKTRSYENKEGQKVWVTEVILDNFQFLDKPANNENSSDKADKPANAGSKRRVPF